MLKDLIKFKKVKKVFDILRSCGAESRFVGGCIRDSLMRIAIKDVDIATTLLPGEIESIFAKHNLHTIGVGKNFGTVIVVVESHPYEITTLRKDIETDGRRATKVEYSASWEEDALRRDFTINAMSYSTDEDKLYDYFNGEQDLKAGVIKFVGDPKQRVQEDFLRILRFFRFHTYFGKHSKIDQKSIEACREYAPKIEGLSGERKYNEFYKVLSHHDRVETIELMLNNNILSHLFKCQIQSSIIASLKRLDSIEKFYKFKTNIVLLIYIIAHFHQIEIEEIVNLFRLSNKDKSYLYAIQKCTKNNLSHIKNNIYEFIYKYGEILLDGFLYLLCIEKSYSLSENEPLFSKAKSILTKGVPKFPLKGGELIEAFNLEGSKFVSELMLKGENFWYESKFKPTTKEILNYLETILHAEKNKKSNTQ